MTTRKTFIAAAALAVAGTTGMAGWLALDPSDVTLDAARGPASLAQPVTAPSAEQPVSETEAAVLPPPSAAQLVAYADARSDAPQPALVVAPIPASSPRPRARRVVAAQSETARATEAAPESEPARARATEPALEPARSESAEPAQQPEAFELVVPANAVLGVRLADGISSETAALEDRVEASVTRDVLAGGRIAIPAGTRLLGSVNEVTRGGKFRETARLGVRFHTLVMDDGVRVPVRVDTIVREGRAPARQTAAKIGGGALGGAIIGGIMGGKKGAVLGGAAGAGAGTAVVAAGDRSVAELVEGALLSVRLTSPVTVMIERR